MSRTAILIALCAAGYVFVYGAIPPGNATCGAAWALDDDVLMLGLREGHEEEDENELLTRIACRLSVFGVFD